MASFQERKMQTFISVEPLTSKVDKISIKQSIHHGRRNSSLLFPVNKKKAITHHATSERHLASVAGKKNLGCDKVTISFSSYHEPFHVTSELRKTILMALRTNKIE